MDYLKKAIWGPDPKEQHRKCNSLIRKNSRALEKSIRDLNALQKKTETLIKRSAKKDDIKSVKTFARELYSIKKQSSRLYKSKAQLDSVGMQIDEAFGMVKLQQNMAKSTIIMREVNTLVKLPELTGTMRLLEQELIKSGIINEMIGDSLDEIGEDEELEEEADEEVNKIVSEFTSEKFNKVDALPDRMKNDEVEEVEEEEDEEALNEMRERLKALQS